MTLVKPPCPISITWPFGGSSLETAVIEPTNGSYLGSTAWRDRLVCEEHGINPCKLAFAQHLYKTGRITNDPDAG